MTYNFCTLFDKNYAFRGLALYDSITYHCPDFKLFILCLDEETEYLLRQLNLKNTTLIKLSDIEGPRLLEAKANRTRGEYCWTLGSVFTNYLLKAHPELSDISYLDSDIYFYSSPKAIYDELGSDSVLIIRHNYENRLKYLEKKSGIYNVALVIFRNNDAGRRVLEDWSNNCLNWCYNKYEGGKFGDQMYLDSWTQAYQGIRVLEHPGADVAPWNVNRYEIRNSGQEILVDGKPLIFYHTHTLRIVNSEKFSLYSSFYHFKPSVEEMIYKPYTENLQRIIKKVKNIDPNFNYGYRDPETQLEKIKQIIKRLLVSFYFSHKKYD